MTAYNLNYKTKVKNDVPRRLWCGRIRSFPHINILINIRELGKRVSKDEVSGYTGFFFFFERRKIFTGDVIRWKKSVIRHTFINNIYLCALPPQAGSFLYTCTVHS